MTAGAEHPRAARRTVLVAIVMMTGVACTSAGPDPAAVTAMTTEAIATTAGEEAIRTAIGAVNAAAAGPVAQQQTILRDLADPSALADLENCPPATTTLRFEPVWGGLRPDPATEDGSESNQYALPTLIRVYTGDRITGTDLTTLQLMVRADGAYITPFCVG